MGYSLVARVCHPFFIFLFAHIHDLLAEKNGSINLRLSVSVNSPFLIPSGFLPMLEHVQSFKEIRYV